MTTEKSRKISRYMNKLHGKITKKYIKHAFSREKISINKIFSINFASTKGKNVLLTKRDPKRFLLTKCGPCIFCRNNYYNVVSYVHIPLVAYMQERSEAERRAIWPCLNVATWRRERSDRAIQQIC